MKNSKPLVSILTDTKNRSGLITRCIESIQNQTYQNYEHIIADGGTDKTEEIVKSYNDPRIKYIKVSEGGPIKQTYEAFKLSKGAYITFLDDDDEYLPEKIEKQLDLIESLPDDYGFIYGSMTYYDNESKKQLRVHEAHLSGGNLLDKAVAAPVICGTPTLMFRRDVFESIGGTWISGIGNTMSDWALVCKVLKQGWKVGALKESYLKIYVNHGSIRMSDSDYSEDSAIRGIIFHTYFLNEYKDIFKERPQLAIYHIQALFVLYMKVKQYKDSVKMWLKLVKLRPNLRTFAIFLYALYKIIKC